MYVKLDILAQIGNILVKYFLKREKGGGGVNFFQPPFYLIQYSKSKNCLCTFDIE